MNILLIQYFLVNLYLVTLEQFTLPLYTIKISDMQQSQFLEHQENQHLRNSTPSGQSIIQDLDNYYNYQYIGVIKLQHNQTILTYRVIFDTGSFQLWLPDKNCQGCYNAEIHGIQCSNLTFNDTCYQSDFSVNITYAVGSLTGFLSKGNFSLNDQNFQIMEFILVTQLEGMEGAMYQGIFGLGNHSLIQWPVSFYLSFGDEQSRITFGGYETSHFADDEIDYFDSGDQWEIDVQQVLLGESTTQQLDYKVIIDSGSSLIMLPQQMLQEIASECQIVGLTLRCPCPTHDISVFPVLNFILSNKTLTLEPEFYVQTHPESAICNLLISAIATHEEKLIILGNPFMRKYYTIFDREKKKVGVVRSMNIHHISKKSILVPYLMTVIICVLLAVLIIKLVNYRMDKYLKQVEIGKVGRKHNYRLV